MVPELHLHNIIIYLWMVPVLNLHIIIIKYLWIVPLLHLHNIIIYLWIVPPLHLWMLPVHNLHNIIKYLVMLCTYFAYVQYEFMNVPLKLRNITKYDNITHFIDLVNYLLNAAVVHTFMPILIRIFPLPKGKNVTHSRTYDAILFRNRFRPCVIRVKCLL